MRFENGLARHLEDPGLGLPYWDWSDLSWDWASFLDRNEWSTGSSFNDDKQAIDHRQRKMLRIEGFAQYLASFDKKEEARSTAFRHKVANSMCTDNYRLFNSELEEMHDGIHNAVGGEFDTEVGAAFDPIFWLHHSFVEKLHAEWQLCRAKDNNVLWHRGLGRNRLESPLKCFNDPVINDPSDPTFNITAQSLIDAQRKGTVCYKYDTVSCKCAEAPQSMRLTVERRLNLGQSDEKVTSFLSDRLYLAFIKRPNIKGILKFKIYVSNSTSSLSTLDQPPKFIGNDHLSIFGSRHDSQADGRLNPSFLHDITDIMEFEGLGLDSRVDIRLESLRSGNGSIIPAAHIVDLPPPVNVLKPRNGPFTYRIYWGLAYNDNGPLRIEKGAQLTFQHGRFALVGEFNSKKAFELCNKRESKFLPASKVVPNEGIHYYFYVLRGLKDCREGHTLAVEVYDQLDN